MILSPFWWCRTTSAKHLRVTTACQASAHYGKLSSIFKPYGSTTMLQLIVSMMMTKATSNRLSTMAWKRLTLTGRRWASKSDSAPPRGEAWEPVSLRAQNQHRDIMSTVQMMWANTTRMFAIVITCSSQWLHRSFGMTINYMYIAPPYSIRTIPIIFAGTMISSPRQ